jgi:hypothetical protein
MEIWSEWDDFYGHCRRYDRLSLEDVLREGGFRPLASAYAFHGLYAMARLFKLLGMKRKTDIAAPHAPAIHWLVGISFFIEGLVLPKSCPGTSLFCLAMTQDLASAQEQSPDLVHYR